MIIQTTKLYKHKDWFPVRFVKLWQYSYQMIKLQSPHLLAEGEPIWVWDIECLLKNIEGEYEEGNK